MKFDEEGAWSWTFGPAGVAAILFALAKALTIIDERPQTAVLQSWIYEIIPMSLFLVWSIRGIIVYAGPLLQGNGIGGLVCLVGSTLASIGMLGYRIRCAYTRETVDIFALTVGQTAAIYLDFVGLTGTIVDGVKFGWNQGTTVCLVLSIVSTIYVGLGPGGCLRSWEELRRERRRRRRAERDGTGEGEGVELLHRV